jgi:hypothetical protein
MSKETAGLSAPVEMTILLEGCSRVFLETPILSSDKIVISTGVVMDPKVTKNASVQQPLFMEPFPFPLSSRAKPRDLQFRGSFLETLNSIPKKTCHLDRSAA